MLVPNWGQISLGDLGGCGLSLPASFSHGLRSSVGATLELLFRRGPRTADQEPRSTTIIHKTKSDPKLYEAFFASI